MTYEEALLLAKDCKKHDIDCSELSKKAKRRDPKKVAAIVASLKAAKAGPDDVTKSPKKAKAKKAGK